MEGRGEEQGRMRVEGRGEEQEDGRNAYAAGAAALAGPGRAGPVLAGPGLHWPSRACTGRAGSIRPAPVTLRATVWVHCGRGCIVTRGREGIGHDCFGGRGAGAAAAQAGLGRRRCGAASINSRCVAYETLNGAGASRPDAAPGVPAAHGNIPRRPGLRLGDSD